MMTGLRWIVSPTLGYSAVYDTRSPKEGPTWHQMITFGPAAGIKTTTAYRRAYSDEDVAALVDYLNERETWKKLRIIGGPLHGKDRGIAP